MCSGMAVEADHVVPIAEGGSELDPTNGQAACRPCHAMKTQAEARLGQRRHHARLRRQVERPPGLV